MGNSRCQDTGLARAGTREHQHGTINTFHRVALLGIETRDIIRGRAAARARGHGPRGNTAGFRRGCSGFIVKERYVVTNGSHCVSM